MAVYTIVEEDDLEAFLADYDVGAALSFKGIAEGVENSNYVLVTDKGRYFLTLYEKRVKAQDLPFFLGLMEYLATRGLPCPVPLQRKDGSGAISTLCGRPAALISFIEGMSMSRPSTSHCRAAGRALADLHRLGAGFGLTRANAMGPDGWRNIARDIGARADRVASGLSRVIAAELDFLGEHWPDNLPRGVIHADLFPDNVLFLRDHLSGVIDFYFACNDLLALDLVITLNAWCFERTLEFNVTKARALVSSYGEHRPLSSAELAALPVLARGAALRFLLTRTIDWLEQPAGAIVRPKDPCEYLNKLRFHQQIGSAGEYGLDA